MKIIKILLIMEFLYCVQTLKILHNNVLRNFTFSIFFYYSDRYFRGIILPYNHKQSLKFSQFGDYFSHCGTLVELTSGRQSKYFQYS